MNINKKILYNHYIEKHISMNKIAKLYSVNSGTIFYYLKKFKIKTRKLKEIVPWNYKGGKSRFPKCKDCSKRLSRIDAIRCKKCDLEFRTGVNGRNYKNGLPKCIDCGKEITRQSERCCQCLYKLWNESPITHPNFRGGISKEPYSFGFTKKLKKEIHERDNFKCQICNMTEKEHIEEYNQKLVVHHIDYNKKNNDKDNLVTLCFICHSKTNGNRNYWKRYFSYSLLN